MPTGESYRSAKKRRLVRAALVDGTSTDLADCPPARKISRIRFQGQAHHPVSKLGDDLLEEILIRLPNPRSACRCKRECKRWNSMLSNPCFNRRFVSHHKSKNEALGEPPLILPSDDPLLSILSFLPVPDEIRSQFVIRDSFKDLLLCGLHRLFLICNPFTKQWVTLPLAPEMEWYHSVTTTIVKLVCKETRKKPNSLDLGDGQAFLYSDYRFRVLVEYQVRSIMRGCFDELQVFCSKSRKWSSRKGLGLRPDAVSLNGKLYWMDGGKFKRFDPFRQNIPPTTIYSDNSLFHWRNHGYSFSASNGALYFSMIEFRNPPPYYQDQGTLRVCRWEEDNMTWMTCYESDFEVERVPIDSVLAQHPEKPKVLFLKCFRDWTKQEEVVFSFNFKTKKFELVTDQIGYHVLRRWKVFQPRTTYFSTPIPSYEKLLGMYNGSYRDLVQTRKST